VAALESALAERDAEIARVRVDLAAFEVRYRQEVGALHEQLDELERAITEAEQGALLDQASGASTGQQARPADTRAGPARRFTSDDVRRLFRDVAKAIHPDLAHDDLTRGRRHTLMIEANRAYAQGDEARLRWILQAWERSPDAVSGDSPEASRLKLEHRLAEIEDQLTLCEQELAALEDTPLAKLKAMVDAAAARGKDLVSEMVGRLKRDIMVARNRLDAIHSRP
jgi:hypothetical protein